MDLGRITESQGCQNAGARKAAGRGVYLVDVWIVTKRSGNSGTLDA
jgi:hypothetical protein